MVDVMTLIKPLDAIRALIVFLIFILSISEYAYSDDGCEEPEDWGKYDPWPYAVKKATPTKLHIPHDVYCYRKPNGQLSHPACKLHPPIKKAKEKK